VQLLHVSALDCHPQGGRPDRQAPGRNMYELTLNTKCIFMLCIVSAFVVYILNIGNIVNCGATATIRVNYTTGELSCFDKPHQKLPILLHKAAFMTVRIFPAFTSTVIPNFQHILHRPTLATFYLYIGYLHVV
jgi:hypothetical protein